MQTLSKAPASAFKESTHRGMPPPQQSSVLSSRAPGSPTEGTSGEESSSIEDSLPAWVPTALRNTSYLAAAVGGFVLVLLLCVWCFCCRAQRHRRRRERTAVRTTSRALAVLAPSSNRKGTHPHPDTLLPKCKFLSLLRRHRGRVSELNFRWARSATNERKKKRKKESVVGGAGAQGCGDGALCNGQAARCSLTTCVLGFLGQADVATFRAWFPGQDDLGCPGIARGSACLPVPPWQQMRWQSQLAQ